MQEEITREQKEQLKTWAVQRDVLLSEISVLRDQQLKLEKTNKDLAVSNTEIITQINQAIGRLEIIEAKESEEELIIGKKLAQLKEEKAIIENQIPGLKREVELLILQKNLITESIKTTQDANDNIHNNTLNLEKVISGIVKVSSDNAHEINSVLLLLKSSIQEMITINQKNVLETNIVLDKLPRMVVELQKHGLIKKI